MKITPPLLPALVLGLCLFAASARADTIYTYTGNPFTDFFGVDSCTNSVGECSISGSFTLAAALPPNLPVTVLTPLKFSFTDGVNTINNKNQDGTLQMLIATGPGGQILDWSFLNLGSVTVRLSTEGGPFVAIASDETLTQTPVGGGVLMTIGGASVDNHPGTWRITTTTATPEPSSLLLLATALLVVAASWRCGTDWLGGRFSTASRC